MKTNIYSKIYPTLFLIFSMLLIRLVNQTNTVLAAPGDAVINGKNLQINQGQYIYFPHTSQSDTNDGRIGAGLFATGLNFVGIKTDATYRKMSIWGETTQIENGSRNTWLGTNYYAGNVGIGKTNPGASLDVNGIIWTSGAGSARNGYYDIGANHYGINTYLNSRGPICTGNTYGGCDGSGGVVIGPTNTAATVNITNTGNTFFNGGNVGIGITNPSHKLHINGNFQGEEPRTAAAGELCFWQDCTNYTIGVGNTADYIYGSVTGSSLKHTMSNNATRGWTWGGPGITPVMALSVGGNFQNKGYFDAPGGFTSGGVVQSGGNFLSATKFGIGTFTPNGRLDVVTGGDGIVIDPQLNGDDSTSIQSYIDGQWANRASYAGGCCNSLFFNLSGGDVFLGNARGTTVTGPLTIYGQMKSTSAKHLRAFATGNQGAAGGWTNFNSVAENVGGFTANGNHFYVPENGTYLITVNIMAVTTASCNKFYWTINKSSVGELIGGDASPGVDLWETKNLAIVTNLTTSEYVYSVLSWEVGDSSCYIAGSPTYMMTQISIVKKN